MGLTPVPAGRVATVVTALEMRERPPRRPLPGSPLSLARWTTPEPARYRALFARVGAPWLWFSRLTIDDAALLAIIHDARVEVYAAVDRAGIEVGLLELDFRREGEALLSYLALVPELVGQGHGGWLMTQAMARVWPPGTALVRVETCTLDHPRALGFYRRQGFVPVGRTVETFADPRLSGVLPLDAAPHVPILR